jgi:hypothetical protein
MSEYAVLDNQGEVRNIVTTSRPLGELQEDYAQPRDDYPAFRVVPIAQVPQAVLERYKFWGKRP